MLPIPFMYGLLANFDILSIKDFFIIQSPLFLFVAKLRFFLESTKKKTIFLLYIK